MDFENETKLFNYLEANAYTGVFSDIMDEAGYRNQVISPRSRIVPLKDDFVAIGRATTLLNVEDGELDDPYKAVIECIDNIKPNSILVTTGDQDFESGIMGELTATALCVRGGRGAIVNGYTRDMRKLLKMDFPTFAWGGSPIDTTGRLRVVDYNIPITIGGVKISPGNLIFADLDGILVIPAEAENEIIEEALVRITTENHVREDLGEGAKMRTVWEQYKVL